MTAHDVLRTEFVTRIDRLSTRADRMEADLRQPGDRDWVERATEQENAEVLDELDDLTRAEINALRHAVERIDEGTYGRCVTCGGEIGAARLQALPTAATCKRCTPP